MKEHNNPFMPDNCCAVAAQEGRYAAFDPVQG